MRTTETEASPGARYMNPLVKEDLARLDKDGETRRSAMNSLKQFVENLDPGSMPRFLAHVSETRDQAVSRCYAISLYEEVARVHGKLIIPHIPRVMGTVTRSLSSSGSSPHLHQACAKVVSAVARYSVDGGSPVQADEILRKLCAPLLGLLTGMLEPLAAGAAVCLQALVECEKWKYATDEVVNEACMRTTAALGEKITRTVAHMRLARSLAATNPSSFKSYGLALLRSGSEVLRQTPASGTWQQRASAARLLQAVLPIVDRATLASELEHTIQALDECRHDRMANVRSAVIEALKTAKLLSSHDSRVVFENPSAGTPCRSYVEEDERQPTKSFDEMRSLFGGSDDVVTSSSRQGSSTADISEDSVLSFFPNASPESSISVQGSPLIGKHRVPCVPHPSSGGSLCSRQVGKHVRPRPTAEFNIPYSPLLVDKMGTDQQSRDIESSSSVTSKGRGGKTYSSLENSVITVNAKQAGAGILVEEEEVSINGTTVYMEVDTDMNSNQGPPSEQSRCNHGGMLQNTFSLVTNTSRASQYQTILNGPTRKNLFDAPGSAGHSKNQSIGAHNVDKCLCTSTARHDRDNTFDSLCDQQQRHSPVPYLRSLEDVSCPQVTVQKPGALITADDFLPLSTPRRLVRTLQSKMCSPAVSGTSKDQDTQLRDKGADVPERNLGTCSEAAWSVRDNPIASDNSLKNDSGDEDNEQQENIHKKMTLRSSTRSCSADLGTDDLLTNDCERLSFALVHAAESLFCTSTGRAVEPECLSSKEEIVYGKPDYKVNDFCVAPPHSQGGLLSLVGENSLSDCFCKERASNRKLTFEGEEDPRNDDGETDAFLADELHMDKAVQVLRIRFFRSLRDVFGKYLRSMQACLEVFLGGFLLVVLALQLTLVISKIMWSHLDSSVLVPT